MTVHRAIIVEPSKLREWARQDAGRYRYRLADRERDLAQISEWFGCPVGLVTMVYHTALTGSAGSEAAEPTPADWRLGPSFPEQRRKSRP
jgi:hypothetical protein